MSDRNRSAFLPVAQAGKQDHRFAGALSGSQRLRDQDLRTRFLYPFVIRAESPGGSGRIQHGTVAVRGPHSP